MSAEIVQAALVDRQPPKQALLEVRDLKVRFPKTVWEGLRPRRTSIRAVDGVSFSVAQGETLGIVGESGCGKSTTARAIVGLAPIAEGTISLGGRRIDGLSHNEMLPIRRDVQMIFQDPYASLNPRWTVGAILREPMEIHNLHAPDDRKFEVMRLMELVGLDPRFLNRYPHEFSGGQRQRIGIARALAVRPKVILCDEPVSALDVSIQAQVLNLLVDLQRELNLTYVFITHDLAVVRHVAHRVAVMYLGRIVELADRDDMERGPLHPYSQSLWQAAPIPDPVRERARERVALRGDPPSPDKEIVGCAFAGRCPIVQDICRTETPKLEGGARQTACFKAPRE